MSNPCYYCEYDRKTGCGSCIHDSDGPDIGDFERLKSDITVRDQYVEELRQRERELLDKLNVAREALLNVEGMLDELRDYPVTYDLILEALNKLES